jgi:hypothetical protein
MAKFTLEDLGATSIPYELKHPKTNEPLGVFIDVVGPDSNEFTSLSKAYHIKNRAKSRDEVPAEELLAYSESLLASCIVGWSDDEFFGGAYSREKVLSILRDARFNWLRSQVDTFTNDRTHFFR